MTVKLTKEEKSLLDSYNRGEWKSTTRKADLQKYVEAARYTLKKDARLNIRISSHDLNVLRKKAAEEGLPYQTFVSSLLHKYVSGQFAIAA